MKLQSAICAIALAAAACSPAPASEETAGDETPAAKRMPLPDCSTVKAEDQGADGIKYTDCRLMFPDQSGMAIEVRYKPAEDETKEVNVKVIAPGDAELTDITEIMGNTLEPVKFEDFDKDGKLDLLVPLETGNPNTTWAAWRQVADGKFVRVGEPAGVFFIKTDSGYYATPGRSNANTWDVGFSKLEADELKPVLTATVVAQGEPDKITGVECTITDDGGLAATGLTPEAAKAQFCAESVVIEIFKP